MLPVPSGPIPAYSPGSAVRNYRRAELVLSLLHILSLLMARVWRSDQWCVGSDRCGDQLLVGRVAFARGVAQEPIFPIVMIPQFGAAAGSAMIRRRPSKMS